jgi:hypothetical protein
MSLGRRTAQPDSSSSSDSSDSPGRAAAPAMHTAETEVEHAVKGMSEMRIDQLPWVLGERYLYCHQECCEHIVCLIDILQPQPSQLVPRVQEDISQVDMQEYPRETFRAKMRKRKCAICDLLSAEYIVYHDRLATMNASIATFFCRTCFQMLHYGADGKLLYDDFLVFSYNCDNC